MTVIFLVLFKVALMYLNIKNKKNIFLRFFFKNFKNIFLVIPNTLIILPPLSRLIYPVFKSNSTTGRVAKNEGTGEGRHILTQQAHEDPRK